MEQGARYTVPTVMDETWKRYPFSSVHRNIVACQYGTVRPWDLYSISKSSKSFIQRLKKYKVLDGHTGCVNTVAWNDHGSLLLTGSDDYLLNIYDTATTKLLHSVESGHRTNVFSAKFLPCTSDLKIVSCSGDGMLQYNELGTTYGQNYFNCHSGTTYEVLVTPGDPNTFLSCGEDGTVRMFDLRTKTKCHCQECAEDILIDARHPVTSFSVNPMLPYHLAIGCKDSVVRVFDRRTLGTSVNTRSVNRNRGWMAGLFCKFRPSEIKQDASRRVTSLKYSNDGADLLVSYCTDYIYLFTVKDGAEKVLGSGGKNGYHRNGAIYDEDSNNSSEDLPPVKRLRLRGDWSDTGPQARPEADEEVTSENNLMQRMSELFSRWIEDAMSATLRRASTSSDEEESSVESQQHPRTSRSSVQNRPVRREMTNLNITARRHSSTIPQQDASVEHPVEVVETNRDMRPTVEEESSNSAPERNINIDNTTQAVASDGTCNSPENGRTPTDQLCSSSRDVSNTVRCDSSDPRVNERTPLIAKSSTVENRTDADTVAQQADTQTNAENHPGSSNSDNLGDGIQNTVGISSETDAQNPSPSGMQEHTVDSGNQDRSFDVDTLHVEGTSSEMGNSSRGERLTSGPSTSGLGPSRERFHSAEFRQRVHAAYTPAHRYTTERQFAASKIQSFIRLHRSRNKQPDNSNLSNKPEHVYLPQHRMRYKGHRNARTMIKEANFWGEDYVLSGSDCGRIFIWDRHTGELVMLLEGDRHVVNCVQPHPFDPILATSGIDHDVKLWAPLLQDPPDLSNIDEIIERNEKMLEESRDTITVPAAFVLRMFASLGSIRRNRRRNQEMADEDDA